MVAWTDQEKKKARDTSGLSTFIIERTYKGFTSGAMKEKWGILAGDTGWFKMDEVEVPEDNILGHLGEGFKNAMFALEQRRYNLADGAPRVVRSSRDSRV